MSVEPIPEDEVFTTNNVLDYCLVYLKEEGSDDLPKRSYELHDASGFRKV
jgi:hypothetical protein